MKFNCVKSKTSIVFIIFLIVILGTAGFFIARKYTTANADYICTKIVDSTGGCTEDGSKVQPSYECKDGVYKRTLFGFRLKTKTTFAWRRTSCPAGFTQTRRSGSGGASGFIADTEKVVLEYQSCPIEDIGSICRAGSDCVLKEGEERNKNGECVKKQSEIDLCTNDNFPGIQTAADIASSLLIYNNIERTCATKGTDICSNLNGPQITLPDGWYGPDVRGECHPIVSEIKDSGIKLGINCSSNNGLTWNDCSRVVLPSRSQPIILRGVIDDVISKDGSYEWSDPEKAGQPKGYFDGAASSEVSNKKQPSLSLVLGPASNFVKDIELTFTNSTNGKFNTLTKKINIFIASEDIIIER